MMIKRAMSGSLLVGLLAIASLATFYFGQRALIFPAPSFELPSPLPDGIRKLSLDAGYALYLPPENPQAPFPLVIYAHGNAEVAYWSTFRFRPWQAQGYGVLLLEYPGYGGAPGTPSFESIRQAALAAFDRALALPGVNPNAIVAYGRSMGGGAAGILAAERPISALILESTFTSLPALVAEKWFPPALVKDRFDTVGALHHLKVPVMVYHGREDNIIPVTHGKRLASAANNSHLLIANCGHNNCPPPWVEVFDFLSLHGVGRVAQRL